jgi:hypothetical protein
MVGDGRLRDAERVDEPADADGLVARRQLVDDPDPVRIAERAIDGSGGFGDHGTDV